MSGSCGKNCVTEDQLEAHRDSIINELRHMNHMLEELTEAFVIGKDGKPDFSGHRSAHEAMIEAAKAQRDFWVEMKKDLAKKGATGLLVIIMGLIVVGIQTKLGFIKLG